MIRTKPLTEQQLSALEQLVQDITPEQAIWLSGYLEGKTSAVALPNSNTEQGQGSTTIQQAKLTVLYGTETGNSRKVAEQLAQQGQDANINVEVFSLYDYKHKKIKDEQNVALVVSTHGQGDPPDMVEDFHTYIRGKRAPKLDQVNYAILALGDKSYKHFCKTGVDIDEAFQKLGATPLTPIVKCDVSYEDSAEAWVTSLLGKLQPTTVIANDSNTTSTATTIYSKKNPFLAPVLEKVKITAAESDKEVYHLEISLEESGITYQPGDSVGIFTKNPNSLVEQILQKIPSSDEVEVKVNKEEYPFKEALKHHLEITILSYDTINKYLEKTQDEKLKALIANDEELDKYLYGHDILDLLEDYPYAWQAQELVDILRPLPPRLYSISSSMESVGEEVHATISVVRYENKNRLRLGACSTNIIDNVEIDEEVAIYIDSNPGFKLPENDKKVIMVGAGTGVAPYRAFLQERESQDIAGGTWLFFGDRSFHSDFLYQLEWQKLLKSKHLEKINVAFSRDQEEKVYVQHKLLENKADVYKWLEEGAHFYVCGDLKHMANDVNIALHNIIEEQGNLSEDEAKAYVKNLKKTQRYQLDVY